MAALNLKETIIFQDEFSACNDLIEWYKGVKEGNETPSDFYCSITNDPNNLKLEHESKTDDAWYCIRTVGLEIASWTEKLMADRGFDCGEQSGSCKEEAQYVYLYRKGNR